MEDEKLVLLNKFEIEENPDFNIKKEFDGKTVSKKRLKLVGEEI